MERLKVAVVVMGLLLVFVIVIVLTKGENRKREETTAILTSTTSFIPSETETKESVTETTAASSATTKKQTESDTEIEYVGVTTMGNTGKSNAAQSETKSNRFTVKRRMWITGYTAEEGFYEGSATASGIGCRPGICAMNNQQRKDLGIQYGDTIYVEGLGAYTVADCGCGYDVIDIWVYSDAEAYRITGYYDVWLM